MMHSQSAFRTRSPAVAGLFYPEDPYDLRVAVRSYLDQGKSVGAVPKALIVPHAGFVYSGPIAASAYRTLTKAAGHIDRVVLAGPTHRVPVAGVAIPEVAAFDTPLGRVPLDLDMLASLAKLPGVVVSDQAHHLEHSLEVQLPFLQMTLGNFRLVPLAVGAASPAAVAAILEAAWGGPETLVVVSSDLSHYHPYAEARRIDDATRDRVLQLDSTLRDDQACGCNAVNGLMLVAARHGLTPTALDLRNSGDTSGDRSRVVGYGAFALYEP
jgi:AmmeMemoRadiSam system protein B